MISPSDVPKASAPGRIRPVFVGGSGRSGTSSTAQLLGNHSQLAMVPVELRVHVRRRGLLDLLEGRSTLDSFMEQITTRWYRRPGEAKAGPGAETGLFRIIDLSELSPAAELFRDSFADDPEAATRRFFHDVLDPIALQAGAAAWVEHSPENITRASQLFRLFPDMKFIHSLRDGRDVASSMTRVAWGPDDLAEGIRWWGRRLRLGHAETTALPADRVFVLRFEDLVERDRSGTYARLLDFLEVEDEPTLRRFFDESIVPDRGPHIGRWRQDVPIARHEVIDGLYDGVLASLQADGVPLPATADDRPLAIGASGRLAVMDQRAYELDAQRDELLAEQTALRGDLTTASQQRDRAWAQRDALMTKLQEHREADRLARSDLTARVAKQRSQADEHRERAKGLRSRVREMRGTIQQLRGEIEERRQLASERGVRMLELQKRIADLRLEAETQRERAKLARNAALQRRFDRRTAPAEVESTDG